MQRHVFVSIVITADKSRGPTVIISKSLQKYISNYINKYTALLYTYL